MRKLYLILVTVFICITASYAQDSLKYYCLYVQNVNLDGKPVKVGNELIPGQVLSIKKDGKIGLISNYYHSIESEAEGKLIIPEQRIDVLSEFWQRPDMEYLMDTLRFHKGQPVKAGLNFQEILWPDQYTPHEWGSKPCVIWNFNTWGDPDGIYDIQILIKDLFDEVMLTVNPGADSMWSYTGGEDWVDTYLKEYSYVVFEVQIWGDDGLFSSESTGVKFIEGFKRHQDPCTASTAMEYLAIAMYLENNYGPQYDWTPRFYLKMGEVGTEPVFGEILENYLVRRGD